MSDDPARIRVEIDETRAVLSEDVDALAYEANPAHMAGRQIAKVKARGARFWDRLLGEAGETAEMMGDRAAELGDAVADAPHAMRRQAQGNPMAAGAVAFGIGLLIAAAFPPSRQEQELAETVKEKAQPVTDQVTEAARTMGENLKQPAQEAVQSLKESATEGVEHVKQEAQSASEDVKDASTQATQEVRRKAS